MIRPRAFAVGIALLGALAIVSSSSPARGDDPPAPDGNAIPSRFLRVVEPITTETAARVRKGVEAFLADLEKRSAIADAKSKLPILVLEFVPGDVNPGKTTPGAAIDLANYLLDEVDHARLRTVAFVPTDLKGYAVLPVLACDEIAMDARARLGRISPENRAGDEGARAMLKTIASKNGREPFLALFLGMLDPTLDVRRVKTDDKRVNYVLASDLEAFRSNHSIAEEGPAWEGGNRGELTAESSGRDLVKAEAADRGDVRRVYGLESTSEAVAAEAESSEFVISGRITRGSAAALQNYIAAEKAKGTKRIFVRISSRGGDPNSVMLMTDTLARLQNIETVAYIEDEAVGLAALIPLACNQIVFKKGAQMGNLVHLDGGTSDGLNPVVLADTAETTARERGHSTALARAMADPSVVLVRARNEKTNVVVPLIDAPALPDGFTRQDTIKPEGATLVLTSAAADSFGLAARVVDSDSALWAAYNLDGPPKSSKPTWVHGLVTTLTDPWMSGLLIFVGLFMLILELKLPGVGLPAIISALAFLLFFWSHYLGGSADGLEILLFLVGIVCLALELFVFPGFAVFGLSGILLILVSVIMASHTFVWPTKDYEFRQMGQTLMEVTGAIVLVTVGAIVVGRYFPSLPLFRRMVLHPEPMGMTFDEVTGKAIPDGDSTYFYLLGEVGRTTTALKPTGKARFGEALVDVSADGFYIEPNAAVEVVEVQGSKIIVKRA